MGVCLVVHAVSDATIAALLADPPLVWKVVEPENDRRYQEERARGSKRSLIAKLLGRPAGSVASSTLTLQRNEGRWVDLDKSWDGLNACLKRCRPGASSLFEGGTRVGSVEVGYGPALCHPAAALRSLAAAWLPINETEFRSAFERADLRHVYHGPTFAKRDSAALEYLLHHFAELQSFVAYVRAESLGVLLQFT